MDTMARPREFNPETVLDAARDLFWQRGYQATSLDELARITGVKKPSLYAAFGDKAALFLNVLDRYHAMVLMLSKQILEGAGSAREAVRAWLTGFLPFCSDAMGAKGCLSINTHLEAGALTPDVRASISAFQRETEALLRAALVRGVTQGEFPAGFDCAGAARVLLVAQSGLMAMARSEPPAAATLASMEHLLDAIMPSIGGAATGLRTLR